MTDREKKEGKIKVQAFECFEKEKNFLNEIKNIFHSFYGAITWGKGTCKKSAIIEALKRGLALVFSVCLQYTFFIQMFFTKYPIN